MVKEKRAHYTGKHKTSLERTATVSPILYFSFLFNQEEKSEMEGKATLLSFVKAVCTQVPALQVFITSLGMESLCATVLPR